MKISRFTVVTMSTYNLKDEKFDIILRDAEDETLSLDPGKTAPSVVGSPTEERQVLAALAVAEGIYGVLQTGCGSCHEPTPMYMTCTKYFVFKFCSHMGLRK